MDDTDAGVVCRSLGFDSGTGVGRQNSEKVQGISSWMTYHVLEPKPILVIVLMLVSASITVGTLKNAGVRCSQTNLDGKMFV